MPVKSRWICNSTALIFYAIAASPLMAEDDVKNGLPELENAPIQEAGPRQDSGENEIVPYAPDFFTQYNPVTARDMVARVPGFQINEGGGRRGFGGSAGNLLINGERPSTKNDGAGEILERISANQVERIDLIRGQTGGLNLRGQSVAVNVILSDDQAPSFRWEGRVQQDIDDAKVTPQGSISMRNRWGPTQYTLGLGGDSFFRGEDSIEHLVNGNGTIEEDRMEFNTREGRNISGNLNTETRLGGTLIHFNLRAGMNDYEGFEDSLRIPRAEDEPPRSVLLENENDGFFLESGGDIEFSITDDFSAKAITLFSYSDGSGANSRRNLDAAGTTSRFTRAPRQSKESETIGRVELDWTRFSNHYLEASFEGAFNTLENSLTLFEDTGDGPVEVPLPGANTRVEEVRGDFEITDSWTLNDELTIDGGVAWEISTITQSGENANERTFFFTKPRMRLTYAPRANRQIRLNLQRQVSQLNFNDFVSSTNFQNEQFDLGNPDLSPENSWRSELSYEQRFGEIGSFQVSGFHHWINDVEDLLPVGGIFEVPGNIGDGRRWGLQLSSTLPLDGLGIKGGRLDLRARWEDSTVEDPVTGQSRRLSGQRRFRTGIDFRQDIQSWGVAWGFDTGFQTEETSYGLDESTESNPEGINVDAFIETTRWLGVKMRLDLRNLTNQTFHRDRRVFEDQRGLSPLSFQEVRDRTRGRSLRFTVSGSF